MTVSTDALDSLRILMTTWTLEHIGATSLAEVEAIRPVGDAADAVRRTCGQVVAEVALKHVTGKKTYQGTSMTCSCGGDARFVGYRPRWVKTVAGEARIERAYYHCGSCGTGHLPWDLQEGLDAQVWSPKLKALVAEVCAHLTYGVGVSLLERLGCARLEESSAEEIVCAVGTRLRQDEDRNSALYEGLPEDVFPSQERKGRLYIGIDAAKAHIDGGWHDVKVATLYEGLPDSVGRDHPDGVEYCAAQEGSDGFGKRTYAQARGRGLARFSECVVIGDGAEFIWNQATLHFPRATQVVDFWHASEHIWSLSRSLYGEGSAQGKRWAQERVRSLKEDGPTPLLRALKRRKPTTVAGKEAVRLERGYFSKHRKRMNYPAYRSRGMMIGSGPVEAGCKTVVCQRMKQAGMRWSGPGSDAMLAVRTAVLSQQISRIEQFARAA